MQFIQDGGLSCVRYYLAVHSAALEAHARGVIQSVGRLVGRLVCQCGAENRWSVWIYSDASLAVAACGCNGSSLPVYIGEPPKPELKAGREPSLASSNVVRCDCGAERDFRLAIAIGYPGDVPALGTVSAECAQEVAIAGHCGRCQKVTTLWRLTRTQPPIVRGDETWIKRIQGLGFGSHGQSAHPITEGAKYPPLIAARCPQSGP